uniref:Phytochrome n=1 Tax=Welwitschia mirabilis TaxID=3377 RepID=A0A059UGL8_WELMI|nr:phytochrome [Welwitschia mirabilis]|eukprot:TRINITY_DN12895_c0_g1_i1.p1 TRINITY_DN12895_c0_g1~~TRINITY_DN12895_c0_g1_i1.p1  ORF type:complete len:1125 (-),score=227.12 TRINITY_DN12895_c0_g1_i1:583-3957(-)
MASSKASASSSSSTANKSKTSKRIMTQTTMDAKIHADFEESGYGFDYLKSIAVKTDSGIVSPMAVSAYLHQIQKSKMIQPFGCLLAVNEKTFEVIAYSENAAEMLVVSSQAVPNVSDQEILQTLGIGTDARTLFTPSSAAALQKASGVAEVNLLNPIIVHSKSSGKPFCAILHRIEVALVIDLEPVRHFDKPMTSAGALQSYKLASKGISRLQSMPSGNIGLLCDMVVKEIHELTGYDRVMAYKFHNDDHGEVISEIRRSDLEPYLGLHYPATDIPQASRFLFMKNRVRMICDCYATPVRVIQDKKLPKDLSFCGSTLRAPHGCHAQYMANMGSVASLVMAVIINEREEEEGDSEGQGHQKGRRLWGLIVCHHTSPRFVPFPLRYACEFMMQVFSIQLNKEVELALQLREKNILRTQTLLCDMLLRESPLAIVTQKPNIMDLVRCDGAALYFGKRFWLLGATPTETQMLDIIAWLSENHADSTGLSTDSLIEAGYPKAVQLGEDVCGMAAVRLNSSDFLFWFRSHTAKEIKWGGAKHDPSERDDGKKMHPRSSFRAFLEVVRWRSLPWEDVEMDAIHSLQLILRNSTKESALVENKGATINAQLHELKIQEMDELNAVTNEMVRLIETATVPILAVDSSGLVNGWNRKAAELTGLSVEMVLGEPLVELVEDTSVELVKRVLFLALRGQEEKDVQIELKTHGDQEENGPVILMVNACSSRDVNGNVVGVCFVAQDVTGEKTVMDKFTRIQGDYKAIVQNPSPLIPPIFGTDEFGWCSEWNSAMEKLTGWEREHTINKMLFGEVFGTRNVCCRLKGQNSMTKLRIVLNSAMAGQETDKFPFGFFDRNGKFVEALLSATKKMDSEGRITGVFCFLHVASPELQQALRVKRMSEQTAMRRLKTLSYLRTEIKNPLSGIMFTQKLLEQSGFREEQAQLVKISALCQKQMLKILDDMDLENIEDGYLELDTVEFTLGELLDVVISQGMLHCEGKGLEIFHDTSREMMSICLYGDQLRLQQILSNLLWNVIQFTPQGERIVIKLMSSKRHLAGGLYVMDLEFRITHPGPGLPEELVEQMYSMSNATSQDGYGLFICRKLVKLMSGDVQYLRGVGTSSFVIVVELAAEQSGL